MIKISILPIVKKYYDSHVISVDLQLINFLKKIFKKSRIEILNRKSSLTSDLLVISGGNTIPKFSKKKEDLIRNKLDNFFYKEAIKKKIPIIGICHGSQFLANKFGAIFKKDNIHGKLRMHDLIIDTNYNKIYKVNSYHNISIKNLSKNFYLLGKTKDNYIEYFKHKKLNITGIMWHPERNYIIQKIDKQILKNILK